VVARCRHPGETCRTIWSRGGGHAGPGTAFPVPVSSPL